LYCHGNFLFYHKTKSLFWSLGVANISTDDNHPPTDGFRESAIAFEPKTTPIGQALLGAGILDAPALTDALERQKTSGQRLGEELISHGDIRPFDFYRSLSMQSGRRFINLRLLPPDAALLATADIDFYLREQCLPWRQVDGTLCIVAVNPLQSYNRLKEKIREPFLLYQTSPLDVLWAVQSRFSDTLTSNAKDCLRARYRDASADFLLSPSNIVVLIVLISCLMIALSTAMQLTLLTLNAVVAFAFVSLAGLRFWSMIALLKKKAPASIPQTARADRDLPIYTIMIPLLREASVLPILADALQNLDYPPSKLDIKLILEASDDETIDAAKQLRLPGNFELILVPTSLPTTKPKACNYALPFARGELLVVYDAEDIPGPGQLREAVNAFDEGGPALACAQAPLAYYNWNENWLTRHFAIEYASIFDLLLPTLARLRQPFPLGGTSTHFRTSILRKIGAWDPFNVTEDADLGIRLHEQGYQTDVLRTPTLEEANCLLPNWVRQRSRWLKGWMQTYIVRMRQPKRSIRQLGLVGFLTFQVVIGAFLLSALVHPFFYAALFYASFAGLWQPDDFRALVVFALNASVLVLGFSAAILAGLAGANTRGLTGLGVHVLTMPAYWLLISFSAYRALFQLISNPHDWEKTEHGLSNMAPAHLARVRGRSERNQRR
jgi:glycosyltransferase XagB